MGDLNRLHAFHIYHTTMTSTSVALFVEWPEMGITPATQMGASTPLFMFPSNPPVIYYISYYK